RFDRRQLAAFTPEPMAQPGTGPGQTDPDLLKGELERQLKLTLEVHDDISRLSRTVEQMRLVKRQIEARNELLKDDSRAEPLVKESKEFVTKLDALEEKLHNPKAKVAYDILAQKGGAQLYSQLVWLFEQLKDADGPPSEGLKEQYKEQAALLQKYL